MPGSELLAVAADDYWEGVLRRSPMFATMVGDHRYDDQIEDLSVEAEADEAAELRDIRAQVAGIDAAELVGPDRPTLGLLLNEIDMRLGTIEHRIAELASDQMGGIHIAMLGNAPEIQALEPEHAGMLVERNRTVPRALQQAADRFRAGLAVGRTPARACITRSLTTIDAYLASDLADDPFAAYGAPDDWAGEPAWRDALLQVSRDVIRPAFSDLRDVIADELLPVARDDDHPGLHWLGDDGAALYATLVREHTTLADIDPSTLHETGMAELARLDDEYRTVGRRQFGTDDLQEVFARLRDDPALRYSSPGELLLDAQSYIDRANAEVGGWFSTLPTSECVVDEVPAVLAADAPAAYYYPPDADGVRPGTYYVNVLDPDQRTRYEMAAVAYHESVPGHHFQLALATEARRLPRFQRLSYGNTAFVEGWALYAERLAEEMGLYHDDIERLGMLVGDSWRACRLVVDTGLHAFGWTRQRAIDFMLERAPMPQNEVSVEVDRYIGIPGQALGYKTGQLEIQRLRADATRRLGASFDLKAFHDVVLGSGTISLPVLQMLVDDWVAASAS